eukprot:c25756_g1_i1 orf=483-1229(-)
MSWLLGRSTVCCSFVLRQLSGIYVSYCLSSKSSFGEISANASSSLLPAGEFIIGSSFCIPRAWIHSTCLRKRANSNLKEGTPGRSGAIDSSKPADFDPSNFDPTECRSPPSEKVLRIVDEIANLTLLEASDLSFLLKRKLGLPDGVMPYYGGGVMPGMAMPQSGASTAPATEDKKPEKSSFDVKIEKYEASSKIKVIKEVRAITSLGLKEAKELVEKPPAILKKGVSKEEAEQIIEKLKAVGATVIME